MYVRCRESEVSLSLTFSFSRNSFIHFCFIARESLSDVSLFENLLKESRYLQSLK